MFTICTWLFSTVKNIHTFSCLRYCSKEVLSREWTVQVYSNQTNFVTLSIQEVDSFTDSLCNRTDSDDYTVSVFCSVVVEQAIFTSCDLSNLVHVFLNNSRNCFIE